MSPDTLSAFAACRAPEAAELLDRLLRLGLDTAQLIARRDPPAAPAVTPVAVAASAPAAFVGGPAAPEDQVRDTDPVSLPPPAPPVTLPTSMSWAVVASPAWKTLWPKKSRGGADQFGDWCVEVVAWLSQRGTARIESVTVTDTIVGLLGLPKARKDAPDEWRSYTDLKAKVCSKLPNLAEDGRLTKNVGDDNVATWALRRRNPAAVG